MAARTMVSRLLDAAETLLENRSASAAYRRRAVSTAYYAVFHALAKACTTAVLPSAKPSSPEYVRFYRALEHGAAFSAFRSEPLSKNAAFERIAEVFITPKVERERADYLPPDHALFPKEDVRELIVQAREITEAISNLSVEQRRSLAAFLLIKGNRR